MGGNSRVLDAGVADAYRPDASRDAAGGADGSRDVYSPDLYRPDIRLGGAGGSGGSGGTSIVMGGTGGRDAWVPDAYRPDAYVADAYVADAYVADAYLPDAPILDTPIAPPPRIYSYNACDGLNNCSTDLVMTAGKSVTLVWDVSGATTLSIDQGVGNVFGTTAKTFALPSPPTETTYTYTLTATNATDASSAFEQVTAEVTVTVVPLAIASFAAEPQAINPGESTTLTAIYLGSQASISHGIGSVASGEGKPVQPSRPTTYTLTVSNRLGDSLTATATVNVLGLDAGIE